MNGLLALLTGALSGYNEGRQQLFARRQQDKENARADRQLDITEELGRGDLALRGELGRGDLGLRGELGRGELSLRGELGRGDLGLRRDAFDEGRREFDISRGDQLTRDRRTGLLAYPALLSGLARFGGSVSAPAVSEYAKEYGIGLPASFGPGQWTEQLDDQEAKQRKVDNGLKFLATVPTAEQNFAGAPEFVQRRVGQAIRTLAGNAGLDSGNGSPVWYVPGEEELDFNLNKVKTPLFTPNAETKRAEAQTGLFRASEGLTKRQTKEIDENNVINRTRANAANTAAQADVIRARNAGASQAAAAATGEKRWQSENDNRIQGNIQTYAKWRDAASKEARQYRSMIERGTNDKGQPLSDGEKTMLLQMAQEREAQVREYDGTITDLRGQLSTAPTTGTKTIKTPGGTTLQVTPVKP